MQNNKRSPWLYVLITFLLCAAISAALIINSNRHAKVALSSAKESAYSEGYDSGYSEGYDSGYDDGKLGNLSPSDKTTVYVTPSGERYHRRSCSSIKGRETEKLQKWEAKERGYTACARCKP